MADERGQRSVASLMTTAANVPAKTPARAPLSGAKAEPLAHEQQLPRSQAGTTPQHLLMTLLGHYWFGRDEHLPSGALVELLAEFGVSEPGARAALNRLTKRGLLVPSKRGRNTFYGLHDPAALIEKSLRRVVAFGARDAREWDGYWTTVAFSVPEAQRQLRHFVRTNLRVLGFVALYDGLWCSPWEEQESALRVLSDLGVEFATVMRVQVDSHSTLPVLSAWDLAGVRSKYVAFEQEFGSLRPAVRSKSLSPSEALVARTKLLDEWREFPDLEPDLPVEMLPADWPRAHARKLFVDLYRRLGSPAMDRCKQIIADHSPELAQLVQPPPFEPE